MSAGRTNKYNFICFTIFPMSMFSISGWFGLTTSTYLFKKCLLACLFFVLVPSSFFLFCILFWILQIIMLTYSSSLNANITNSGLNQWMEYKHYKLWSHPISEWPFKTNLLPWWADLSKPRNTSLCSSNIYMKFHIFWK